MIELLVRCPSYIALFLVPLLHLNQPSHREVVRHEAIYRSMTVRTEKHDVIERASLRLTHRSVITCSHRVLTANVGDVGLYLVPGRVRQLLFAAVESACVAGRREQGLDRRPAEDASHSDQYASPSDRPSR